MRSRLASVLWLPAAGRGMFLAGGARLVALGTSQDDPVVGFVLDGARRLDLSRIGPVGGHDAATRDALVRWGLVAVGYPVVGWVLDRLVRPRPRDPEVSTPDSNMTRPV